MRIVGGAWAGKPLLSPGGRVRPTSETVRSRWLDLLEPYLRGARVLDLFSGSGALGLEALSRGAAATDFVENGAAALHALKANVAACRKGSGARIRIFKKDAVPFVDALGPGAYDVVLADPPYGSGKLDRIVSRWIEVPYGTILSVEHDAGRSLPAGGSTHDFGETVVTIFGWKGAGRPPGSRSETRSRERPPEPVRDKGYNPSRKASSY